MHHIFAQSKLLPAKIFLFMSALYASAIFSTGEARAGHLFTQASSNTPTWIQAGQGIAIDQYGIESGPGSGSITINFEQPAAPAGADTSNNNWWQWSAGDVMEISLPLTSGTYTYSIAYDAAGAGGCAYDFCGDTTGSSSTASALGSGVVFPPYSGEKNGGGYTSADTSFRWSIVSLGGEFAIGGYRIYTNAGTIDGTGSGPLDQSSVVSAAEATSGVSTRDINASGDVISDLVDAGGSVLNSVFDGGELIVDQDLTADDVASFALKSSTGNAQLNVASGNTHSVGSQFTDDTGSAGVLEKVGDGTLVLTNAANDYTGGTTVSAGTLQVASDDVLGAAAAGIVLDGGILATTADMSSSRTVELGASNGTIDTSSDTTLTLSGVVSGSGSLTKTGAGVLSVTGTNTYSGGTTVSAGKLEIASDSVLGATSGGVTLDGATLTTTASFSSARGLVVGSSGGTLETASGTELTLSGVIAGTSPVFNKTGDGKLIITGTSNTYAANTSVRAGTLDLSGSLASEVTVASGARIEGTGSAAGALTSSGTVAPGNSPGTLSFADDVTFNATNDFVTELDGLSYSASGGAGSYDRLAVTGATATFTADGTITPVLRGISAPANNTFDPVIGNAFRVVTTANASGVSGAFSTVADPASGMPTNTRFDVLYGGNYVDLVLTPDDLSTFAAAYGIQNMVNAAEAFDGIRPAQGTNGTTDKDKFFNGLYGLTAQETAAALLQASGEVHAFALSDARDTWGEGLGTVRYSSQRKGDHYWVDMSGYNLTVDQDLIASAYDSKTRKFWIGSDVYTDRSTTYGVALGVSESELTMANSGSAETTTYSLAAYMRGAQGAFEYDGLVSFNRSNIDTKRNVSLSSGSVSNASSSDATGLAMSAQLGYRHKVAPSSVNGLIWIKGDLDKTRTDTFTEDGSSVTALTVSGDDAKSAKISVGYTLSGEIPNSGAKPALWSFGIGATKDLSSGMPYISRTMSLHDASWSVSVPEAGDVTKFVSGGISIQLGKDTIANLSLSAATQDGSLSKSASFGISTKW